MTVTTHCPTCGLAVPSTSRYCNRCGAALGQPQLYPSAMQRTGYATQEERNWALFCHLSALLGAVVPLAYLIAPLVIWMAKRNESAFINDHGKEAVNFALSITLYYVVSFVLFFALFFTLILAPLGFILPLAVALFHLIAVVIAGVRAGNGQLYRYPLTIRFIS